MKYTLDELSVEITYKCPMHCLHCSSRAELGNDTMIPTDKILEMIDRCKEFCGTKDVSLSGGEPFEHPDFWEILRYIKENELRSIVYSCGIQRTEFEGRNGTIEQFVPFSSERIYKLRGLCDVLIISMHGLPIEHNKIMNIGDGAYTAAMTTIRRALDAGIKVEIHFVPTKVNYKTLKYVYGMCLSLGVSKMSILRYVPQGRGLETSKKEGELNLTKDEFAQLQCDMWEIKNIEKLPGQTRFRIGIPADFTFLIDYLDGNENARKEKACTGGKTKILVKADGLVQVCPAWKELDHLSAGNIYQEDIVDIWEHGDTYCKFREFTWKELKEPCKSCKFVRSCLGGCAAQRILNSTMEIDGLKEAPDPLCFYIDNGNLYDLTSEVNKNE